MKLLKILALMLITGFAYADPNVFEDTTIGFKVTKPSEWRFVTSKEHIDNLKRIELEDEDIKQKLIKYSRVPLVAMAKYPDSFNDLNPSFKVTIRPIGKLRNATAKQILEVLETQFKTIYQNCYYSETVMLIFE